jgi:hypothetical protein
MRAHPSGEGGCAGRSERRELRCLPESGIKITLGERFLVPALYCC